MEDPPQDMTINTPSSSQVQIEIVESSNPDDAHEKTQAALQSTTAPPAKEVRVIDISLDDPHQHMIINIRSRKHQITGSLKEVRFETTDADDGVFDHTYIRRVPRHMREDRGGHLYEPVMVSIGPYHHNKTTQYSRMERFKKCELDSFMEKSVAEDKTKGRDFYYGQILERISEIRGYYQGVGPKEYTHEALTELILCDACFLVSYIKSTMAIKVKMIKALGNVPTIKLVEHDIWRVENQIPFFIINQLLQLRFGEGKAHEIVREYLSTKCFKDGAKLQRLPWKNEYRPLHLLGAYRLTLWSGGAGREPTTKNGVPDERTTFERWNNPNHSVAYLQAKGIYIKPSSECLQDIRFTSYYFFGVLHLPTFFINKNIAVIFQNVVAFERTWEGMYEGADLGSYVIFMNTMLDTSKDVQHLRERGILYSDLGSDEEVLQLFKQINTYELDNHTIYDNVRREINKHCKCRFKTWMADLFQNYCRGPWASIAILAATAVLCLTATQTYYAIHPKN